LRTFGAILLVVAAIALPSTGSAQRLYKWTDDKGVVHYTDKIPPEYANRDRDVLNDQGVRLGFEEGEVTEAERAVAEERAAAAEREQQARAEVARRDRMLLETYLSVADIEDLRNRRLELLESQIKVTELYLTNLRKKLVDLQSDASNFKPYASREGAPRQLGFHRAGVNLGPQFVNHNIYIACLMPRILLVKTSSLGDVVHNLPVASDIAQAMPGWAIDWTSRPSRPGTGFGVTTIPASRSACDQASSEAMACGEW